MLTVSGGLCGAVVQHRRLVYATGFGPGRRLVNGFGSTAAIARREAGPGKQIDSVCAYSG